jgi:hypothetical protein
MRKLRHGDVIKSVLLQELSKNMGSLGLAEWLKWWSTYLASLKPWVQTPVLKKKSEFLFLLLFFMYLSVSFRERVCQGRQPIYHVSVCFCQWRPTLVWGSGESGSTNGALCAEHSDASVSLSFLLQKWQLHHLYGDHHGLLVGTTQSVGGDRLSPPPTTPLCSTACDLCRWGEASVLGTRGVHVEFTDIDASLWVSSLNRVHPGASQREWQTLKF